MADAESKRGPSQATKCVELALRNSVDLFHDGDRAYSSLKMNGHIETHANTLDGNSALAR